MVDTMIYVSHTGSQWRLHRLAKSFESTTTSATGWLQVACIATTLRYLSRPQTQRHTLPVAK